MTEIRFNECEINIYAPERPTARCKLIIEIYNTKNFIHSNFLINDNKIMWGFNSKSIWFIDQETVAFCDKLVKNLEFL